MSRFSLLLEHLEGLNAELTELRDRAITHSPLILDVVATSLIWPWRSIPLAETWCASNVTAGLLDLTTCTQVRVTVRKHTGVGTPALKFILKYTTAWSEPVGEWLPLAEVAIGGAVNQLLTSGWVTLPLDARQDIYVGLASVGGDGTGEIYFGCVRAHFR